MVLATTTHESPTTQDGTKHLMTVSRLLFEGTMATCHPPGIAEDVGKVPRSKLQRVSSEVRRTPDLGQAVNQSAEMRSALVFFATAHSFRERSLESVN